MEKKSRKELLIHIEEQNQVIQKYRTKLHDVIASYKGLVKEKEALEASVKVLTDSCSPKEDETSLSKKTENGGNTDSTNDDAASSEREEPDPQTLQTLKVSLGVLTAEKTRLENELKADRRKLLQEKEDIIKQLTENENMWQHEKNDLESQIQELKKKIRDQQRERTKEQQDHAIMLKELQSLLAEERAGKEELELHVDELKQFVEKSRVPDKKAVEYEKCIQELKQELKVMEGRLHASEDKAKKPSPLLLQLQEEMSEIKAQHQKAIDQESKRANEAEEKLNSLAAISEERVASLESRLSELSQMIGNYDRLRQQDLSAIQKLKDRVTQLDVENSALARTVSGDRGNSWEIDDDSNLDVQTLMDRMLKLKAYLRLANQRSEKPINISEFLSEIDGDENPHARCQEELQQLKEEFERYKLRAQSVLKNKNSRDTEASEELNKLKSQVVFLQEQLQTCKSQIESSEEYHRKTIHNLQISIQEMKTKHKHEIATLESDCRAKILELEHQLQKQRERTLTLLEEKDTEISLLRSSLLPSVIQMENPLSKKTGTKSAEGNSKVPSTESPSSEVDYLTDTLSHILISPKKEAQLLYYAQEIARKDVEISNLRSARVQAESALRELQQIALMKEEKYVDEIDTLKSQIKRLECSQSHEGISMEYLKNVILQYVMCQDDGGKVHMLNAIATVLHFTPRELQQVKSANHYSY